MTEQTAADQINDLAEFIMQHVPGEPSRSEGAVDTAIRVIQSQQRATADLADAIRLTVEYLGLDILPAQPGWSWYDALAKHNPALLQQMLDYMPQTKPRHAARASAEAPQVGPHEFQPLSWTSSLRRHRGKCARCYWPRNAHPIRAWVVARPIGDTTGFVQAP